MPFSGTHAEGQLQALIGTAVDGIMSIDRHGIVDLYNPACERIFGWTPDEVIGRNVSMLMPPRYAHRHDGFIERYIDTGDARIIGIGREVEGLRKDGSEFPMDLSVGEFETGGDRRFVGIVRDLTERVAAERRLRELQAQLSHMGRVSAVAEMGTALAHELNQPLTAIALFLAASDKALESDPAKARSLFARAQQESQRAGDIVRRIRQMVERGDDERRDIELSELITGAAELCSVADVDGRTAIDISRAQSRIMIHADATQIRQVMVNLIRNAMDATAAQKNRTVRVRTRLREDMAEIDVEDNGPGIDPQVRPRLFSPFVTSKKDGLGIGLSICRTIAEAHGGSLELLDEPEPGALSGARFRLALPMS
ncbi:PAS domain S-box protein [Hyphobacterium sp. SN044]|uniref:two-component system sensor histidine kinase NtrB n=1 Tax=Hyphobacterium sp. SN044 TaxID=2912575 RepID=UPI001F19B7B3|nr:PAS domain-containing sensor histidine kinase [Hyphobacterium sp. SN044]MCF8880698.1 PAS domain S-box protein [Hyphobacterium sp. SN044]